MQIEITGEAEKLVQAALASGRYTSAEEFIAAMARRLHNEGSDGQFGELPKHIDIDTLAAAQGMGPVRDYRDLNADFWPQDESIDAFVGELRALREQDLPRTR
jgi:hypothetical protein